MRKKIDLEKKICVMGGKRKSHIVLNPPCHYRMKNNEILLDRLPTLSCIMILSLRSPPFIFTTCNFSLSLSLSLSFPRSLAPALSCTIQGTSVLHEMHKMTGLRQPVHPVTKITVSYLLQLIHHCHWSDSLPSPSPSDSVSRSCVCVCV